jgi:hypothetical protein
MGASVTVITVPYVLGGTETEQQRLIKQAQGLEKPARWLLDQIGIRPGAPGVYLLGAFSLHFEGRLGGIPWIPIRRVVMTHELRTPSS